MYKLILKRIFDIIGSLILLPLIVVVILLISPFIYFTDRGPIFYNADRIGKCGKHFKMFKLRSMYVNSPNILNSDGSTFNGDSDPRVTPIGRLLRKTSLDEFPQFINVLIGDMSFVGPRPTIGQINYEELTGDKKKRYSIKPGITGYSQAYYRNSITQEEKYKYDAYYADHITFGMDIKILLMSVWSVVSSKNINTEQSYKKP